MIPLRPTINLYYDKIIDEMPVPNGVTDYKFSGDTYRIPMNRSRVSPINFITILFNTLRVLNVERVNLFSGNETAKNLFYPLELNAGTSWYDAEFEDYIPIKSINKIRKGKMKLLIFAPRLAHDYSVMWKLRTKLDMLGSKGITRDKIYIVLGDISRSYRKCFDNPNVYGIDWWQIYAQLAYKSRYGQEDYFWAFRDPTFHALLPEEYEKEDFKFENWQPKRIFTALTGNRAIHNTALISELIYTGLDAHGEYSYNLNGDLTPKDYDNFRIIDKTRSDDYIAKKKEIINSLTYVKKLDRTLTQISTRPLNIDKSYYEDSLITIVSGSFSPMFDQHYLDEIDVCAPGLGIWRQIAKGHPLMALGCLNTMGYISGEGYYLPNPITNQFYDRVSKTPQKVKLMCENISRMAEYSEHEIKDKVEKLIPYMDKNKQKFFNMKHQRKFEKLFGEMNYE